MIPSRWRLVIASSEWASRMSLTWSVRTRLCSSGIARSKLRSPASMWAIGMRSFTAASAPASVELTSPATTQRSISRSISTRSTPTSAFAVCSPCVPGPTPRNSSGRGIPSSRKKTSDIASS